MKILALHCDYIRFKALKKALKSVEELSEKEKKEHEVKEPLVILTAVEKADEADVKKITLLLVENIKDLAKQVKAERIVLYPYAHLSSQLSSPDAAQEVLVEAEKLLKKDHDTYRAPFGYYKEFELKCKGHPLAELSREINLDGERKIIVKAEAGKRFENEKPLTENDVKNLLREISRSKLDTTKLKENDHRILGQKLDLFSFNEVAPGMVFWHNNGWVIYNELINFWREEHRKAGYEEISTPLILDKKLWQISGHWEKYKDNIFLTGYEGKDMAVKPMNCPGGILVYKSKPRSYKEFPIKMGELGIVHRQELSGVLAGLFRVIRFTQDDAHVYCTEDMLEEEIRKIIDLDDKVYKKFGMPFFVELSTRPEKRMGDDKLWDKAEAVLENVLKKNKIKYKLNPGDGAFYGPKIDFHLTDSLGRTWQCGTIQLDFAMPERFDLTYTDKDGKEKRPVMLHRTVLGSFERFIGVLLEHLNGNLPTWLSPIQLRILSFTDRNIPACKEAIKKIAEKIPNVRIDADFRDIPMNAKVRDAEMMKIPYVLVIGDKEEEAKTLAVRKRGEAKPKFGVKAEEFIEELREEIAERK